MSENAVATVLAAYVSNHDVDADQLPAIAQNIRVALGESAPEPEPGEAFPGRPVHDLTAKEIKDAVKADGILCFEDGKRYKTLKRTLARFGFTDPQVYFRKWGLPPTFPLTCTEYGEQRQRIAKEQGLGHKRAA